MAGRGPALVALLVLGAALAAIIAWTTPWQPLPGPVPGGRTVAEPGRDFTASEQERENDFHRAVRPPAYASLALGVVVLGLLGLTPAGARVVDWSGRLLGGGWAARAALGAVALTVVVRVVTLPLDARAEVALRRYGLSTQSWGGWLVDQGKACAVAAVLLVVAALGFYAIARAAPRTWWSWSALAGAALTVAVSFAYPLVVEPVFNRFTSMPAGELRTSLLELAARDGVAIDDVLVADASRRTTALNAYVSGLGSTRRIVVFDTLVEKATPEEVRLVVAHELGHVVEHDVRDGTLVGALGVATSVALLFLILGSAALLRRAGVGDATDPRGLALLLFLVTVLGTVSGPLHTLVSRRVEARADVHSLELTRDPETFVASERRLALTNLGDLDPHPVVYGLFFTHPSGPQRIALARDFARREGLPDPLPRAATTP